MFFLLNYKCLYFLIYLYSDLARGILKVSVKIMFIECISNATSIIKGIWSDPLCKETNARFTASSKSLSVHPGQRTSCVYLSNSVKITVKSYCVLLYCMNTTKLTLLWSVKSPKGTVVNRTPHSTMEGPFHK